MQAMAKQVMGGAMPGGMMKKKTKDLADKMNAGQGRRKMGMNPSPKKAY